MKAPTIRELGIIGYLRYILELLKKKGPANVTPGDLG